MRVGIEIVVGTGFIIGFIDVTHGLVEVGTLFDSLLSILEAKVTTHVGVFLARGTLIIVALSPTHQLFYLYSDSKLGFKVYQLHLSVFLFLFVL